MLNIEQCLPSAVDFPYFIQVLHLKSKVAVAKCIKRAYADKEREVD